MDARGTREAFLRDPAAWWQGYLDRGYESFKGRSPNPAHVAMAELTQGLPAVKVDLGAPDYHAYHYYVHHLQVVTQNVDGLHDGVPSEQLVEVHGRLGLNKCIRDGCRFATRTSIPLRGGCVDASYVRDPPKCSSCGGYIMPQFLCFDEQYESHDYYQWRKVTEW